MSIIGGNIDWDLMGKYLANEVNHFEKKRFESAIKNNEGYEKAYLNAKEAWEETGYALQYQQINKDQAFANVMASIKARKREKSFFMNKRFLAIAASSLLIIAVSSLLFFLLPNADSVKMHSLSTADANKSLVLADGSQIEMNKLSTINYPSKFIENNRSISFEGEGFFTIKPDATKPFIVSVGEMKVKVLGTAFNIKAYPGDESIEVVVDHGKVEVSYGGEFVTLTPGYRAVVHKQTGALLKSENINVNYNSWNTKKMVFVETPLSDVVSTLQSVYGVKIDFKDSLMLDNRLTANFYRTDLENVVKVVCRTFNFEYQKEDDHYIILKEKSK
jgi:transmembrane sensor